MYFYMSYSLSSASFALVSSALKLVLTATSAISGFLSAMVLIFCYLVVIGTVLVLKLMSFGCGMMEVFIDWSTKVTL
jgi:hypothetical protein